MKDENIVKGTLAVKNGRYDWVQTRANLMAAYVSHYRRVAKEQGWSPIEYVGAVMHLEGEVDAVIHAQKKRTAAHRRRWTARVKKWYAEAMIETGGDLDAAGLIVDERITTYNE